MSTQPTEAHRKLWSDLYKLAHREIFEDYAAASEGPATQLIADSEARAVEKAFPDSGDDSLYNLRRLRAELAAARSERDLAITRVASILWSGAIDKHTCGDVQKWTEDYTAELTRLRAEVERLNAENNHLNAENNHQSFQLADAARGLEWQPAFRKLQARAEKAEAECLEQARLLGMSGEREADLLGKIERLERELAAMKGKP